MTEKEKKYGLVLAALLIDIGKFIPVSNEDSNTDLKGLSLSFFDDNLKERKAVNHLKDYISGLLNDKPDIICEADELSARAEKISTGKNKSAEPLTSILSRIDFMNPDKPLSTDKFLYPPRKLNFDDIFPIKVTQKDAESLQFNSERQKLFDEFIKEIKLIPDCDISSLVESIIFLFEKYLVYISAGKIDDISDVSLYDNSKTIAALAICKKYSEIVGKPFLIIAADLSGIQNFIYAEIGPKEEKESKAKRLRGKSFYLSLLTDLFSDYILNQLDLPRTNILLNGGGHFVIIAPNSETNKEIVLNSVTKIQKWFYSNFKGNLNLVLDTLEADDAMYIDFPIWYNKIAGLLLRAKKQRSFYNLDSVFDYNLDSMNISEYERNLGEEFLQDYNAKDERFEKNLILLSSLFEKIGQKLPQTEFLLQISANIEAINNLTKNAEYTIIPFPAFEMAYYFCENKNQLFSFLNDNKVVNFNKVQILAINDTEKSLGDLPEISKSISFPISVGFKFMGNNAPKGKYGVMNFEELSKENSEDEKEGKKLSYELAATLRMDVDNLGAIFSQGLERGANKQSIRTLSRTVALSRELNLFFGGYLNKIAERWKIYITYSGGDDLFVVGSWINIVGFALQVKKDFSLFACNNPYVTISGGIYLHKSSFPIGRAAQYAGEAEEKAKQKFLDKDCISIFDRELKWSEFEKYLLYGKELDELVDRKDRPVDKSEAVKVSFLHFLLEHSNNMFDTKTEEFDLNRYFSLINKIRYFIARRAEITAQKVKEADNNTTKNRKVLTLSKLVNSADSEKYLENLIIPASYVILKNRDINKQQNQKEY